MDNLIKYRLDAADEKLTSAKLLLDAGLYKDSVGRSYYAIFSAIRAVLATKQDAEEQYKRAEEMLNVVKKYIQEN